MKVSKELLAIIVSTALVLAGVIYHAGQLDDHISQMEMRLARVEAKVDKINGSVHEHHARISVLEELYDYD